jgi:uncharacterized membrane protein
MLSENNKTERRIFITGCILLALELVTLGILWIWVPHFAARVCGVIATTGVGGQAGAVLAGLELGMSRMELAAVLSAFNVMHLCVFFPLITALYNQASQMKVIGKWISSTRKAAEYQRNKVRALGNIGLPIFIWLPFPWTGTLIGAVIGYLIGLPTRKIMIIALTSMFAGIVTWVFGVNWLKSFAGIQGTWTIAIIALLVLAFAYFRMRNK